MIDTVLGRSIELKEEKKTNNISFLFVCVYTVLCVHIWIIHVVWPVCRFDAARLKLYLSIQNFAWKNNNTICWTGCTLTRETEREGESKSITITLLHFQFSPNICCVRSAVNESNGLLKGDIVRHTSIEPVQFGWKTNAEFISVWSGFPYMQFSVQCQYIFQSQ